MKKYVILAFLMVLLLAVRGHVFAEPTMLTTPVGYWNTVDDKTGQILSVVQIYQEKDGSLSGKIVRIYPVLGQKTTDLCKECDGGLKDQPILGMKVMWAMLPDTSTPMVWNYGHLLDPKSGNIYSGKMTLANDGQSLVLRGYVIMPLLGRSETWQRTNAAVA